MAAHAGARNTVPLPQAVRAVESGLEVEAQLRRIRTRRNEVGAAERGKEVVDRGLVRQVDGGETQAPLVVVAVEEIVFAYAGVKQVARLNARRIVVGVVCPIRRKIQERGALRCGERATRDRVVHRSESTSTEKPDRGLLISIEAGDPGSCADRRLEIRDNRVAGHKPAIVPPVHGNPRQSLPWLILHMGRLVERLVVVDAEHSSVREYGSAQPPDLWGEIACPDVSKNGECRQAMIIGHAHADGGSINLRALPCNREENRCVAERAEVISVVRVLPQVVGVHHDVFSKGLLKAGIELVALARANRRLQARAADHIHDDGVARSQACQNQVLIEGGLQDSRVGEAKNRARLLDVVGNANARLRLPIVDDSAIQISPKPQIEGPIAFRDRVLEVKRQLFDVRATAEGEQRSSAR